MFGLRNEKKKKKIYKKKKKKGFPSGITLLPS